MQKSNQPQINIKNEDRDASVQIIKEQKNDTPLKATLIRYGITAEIQERHPDWLKTQAEAMGIYELAAILDSLTSTNKWDREST